MNKLGDLIVLSGPSGVGKSTLVGKLREALPELDQYLDDAGSGNCQKNAC